MAKLVILLAILAGFWYWWSYQKRLPDAKRRGFLWKSGFWTVLAVSVYLVLTGRMHWLGAGLAALIPLFKTLFTLGMRALPLVQILSRFKTAPSQFRTQSLVVTINFATRQIDGEILAGEFTGKQLSELAAEQLHELANSFKSVDRESYVLLQAYLLRSGSNNHQSSNSYQSSDNYQPNSFSELSSDEAYEVLGLQSNASKEEVIKAHKRLIQRLHPDRGGSDYLAAKINSAKDKLI